MNYEDVIDFWFGLEQKLWWSKDEAFDAKVRTKFGELHQQAKSGELHHWRTSALGSLAEIIVLDQFSRNIYRDLPDAFACDAMALTLSQVAIAKGFDSHLPVLQRSFLYIPFMHSESQHIHQEAVTLYESLEDPDKLSFELRHKEIIDRFGRYPHRNAILGRQSTEEEIEFLKQPGSGF